MSFEIKLTDKISIFHQFIFEILDLEYYDSPILKYEPLKVAAHRHSPKVCSFLTPRKGGLLGVDARKMRTDAYAPFRTSVHRQPRRTHTLPHNAIRVCAHMCPAVVTTGTRATMPIITYRPRDIPLFADSSRCCLIHATPRSVAVF